MNQVICKKILLLVSIFVFISYGDSALALSCSKGSKQECGTCGLRYCLCTTNIITGIETCEWETGCHDPEKPATEQTINWLEYKCQGNGCGKQYIQGRKAYQDQTRTVTCSTPIAGTWITGTWVNSGDPYYTPPYPVEICDLDWQLCIGGTDWSRSERECSCAGECLETPSNVRYYNDPNYPTEEYDPEESKDSNNIYLPVKIDWDNTKAWKNGWKEDGIMKYCNEDCFQSYAIWINDLYKPVWKSEYNPTEDQGSCFLKSRTTYNWGVMACCNADGTNCSDHSNWSFKTNSSPEIITPDDPDWDGPEINEDITIPVEFDWCDVPNTKSYVLRIYADGVIDNVTGTGSSEGTPISKLILGMYGDIEYFTGNTNYEWDLASCINSNATDCGAGCGSSESYQDCGDFTQKRFLLTQETELTPPDLLKPLYNPNKPGEIPGVNVHDVMEWRREDEEGRWARGYYFEVKKGNQTIIGPRLTTDNVIPLSSVWQYLDLNQTYNWHVKSCYDEEGTDCTSYGVTWYFKTTGTKPNLYYPANNSEDIIIPIDFDWEDVSGAGSYRYNIATDSGFNNIIISEVSKDPSLVLDYPDLDLSSEYWWRISTCADDNGVMCGDWSEIRKFETFELGIPVNPSHNNGMEFNTFDKYLSWEEVLGAKAYQYKIYYGGREKISPTVTETNSIFIQTSQFLDLGTYTWYVRACIDQDCLGAGEWSDSWTFNLVQSEPIGKAGFVPCGGNIDYPDTPWNEREQCGIQHLFIMLQSIINFFLWKVSLFILPLLIILTGITIYYSLGRPTVIIDIKKIWKAAGIGYGIIFFAWTIVNLLIRYFGYSADWWTITF
jgi:hypothetical protein